MPVYLADLAAYACIPYNLIQTNVKYVNNHVIDRASLSGILADME